MRLLIVEDNASQAGSLQKILAHAGHEVRAVATVEQARAEAESQAPEAILLDWMLPDELGTALLSWLRQHLTLASVPVLVMTGYPPEQVGLPLATNVRLLQKPFEVPTLLATLEALVTPKEKP